MPHPERYLQFSSIYNLSSSGSNSCGDTSATVPNFTSVQQLASTSTLHVSRPSFKSCTEDALVVDGMETSVANRQADRQAGRQTPSCGTSCFRSIIRIWSSVLMDGDRPPCTQNTCSSIMACDREWVGPLWTRMDVERWGGGGPEGDIHMKTCWV